MNRISRFGVTTLLTAGLFGSLCPIGEAKTFKLACNAKKTIGAAVLKLKPGDILVVSGTCNENVVIPAGLDGITIDGQDTATINGVDTSATLQIRASDITIRNLIITGGNNGIQVNRGGSATIDSNTVQAVGTNGILVLSGSSARIINNTIQDNINGCGISVSENSAARIGFLTANDVTASPNTIQTNDRGVCVRMSSNARIVGNTISNNVRDGVFVHKVSHADISSNTINGNGEDGIRFGENSGVNLGADSGTDIFDSPNSTTVDNTGFGISCFLNSYAQGRLGTLNGTAGAAEPVSGGCINSLI